MDPSTHTVYVTNLGSHIVWVINEATNTVTAAISMDTARGCGRGGGPVHAHRLRGQLRRAKHRVGDQRGHQHRHRHHQGRSIPGGVGVDPSTHTVYVVNTTAAPCR